MTSQTERFAPVSLSLADLVGAPYIDAVCEARSVLAGENRRELQALATQSIDFYPVALHERLLALLPKVGERIIHTEVTASPEGATSKSFQAANHSEMAPLTGYGFYRVGEDGRLNFITKSEHYHASVGHAFPGYRLIEQARRLGITNATHNNTRGHITRLLEEELVRAAGSAGLDRVLNLETGSLVVEAALKMVLARFYASQNDAVPAPYAGRIPVLMVMGNDAGERSGNYHGTTMLTQTMRGMWPVLYRGMEDAGLLRVCPIRPDSIDDLEAAFRTYEGGRYKIAGFFHEIVMMNYGARTLSRHFLQRAYDLCRQHDVPTVVDEIQSCMWAPGFFLFREYGLQPTFVAVGKGFPGGEYPASRLLFSSEVDCLPQFGALVTNGQEELASLAYLVTMRWADANREQIRQFGDYFAERLADLAARFQSIIVEISGSRHLAGITFRDLETARKFAARMNGLGFDISAQTYKADCPPVVLTKIPLICCPTTIDFILEKMSSVLNHLSEVAK
ncbi:MAG: aminotransferase class III-fold pyridoxal phosphate-dependent enzyme [Armatimonadota bacterium]